MGKLFGGFVIAAAVMGSLAVGLVSGTIVVAIPLLAIAASVVLLLDRRAVAVLFAVVLIVLGVMTIPASLTDFTVGGGGEESSSLNLFAKEGSYDFSTAAVVAVAMLIVVAFLVVEFDAFAPKWALYVSLAAAAVVLVWAFFIEDNLIGNPVDLRATLPLLILALVPILGGVYLWMMEPPGPRRDPR